MPRNVCPDCEQNLIPLLHPSLRKNAVCKHQLAAMSTDQLLEMFPAAKWIFRDVPITQVTTQREVATDVTSVTR